MTIAVDRSSSPHSGRLYALTYNRERESARPATTDEPERSGLDAPRPCPEYAAVLLRLRPSLSRHRECWACCGLKETLAIWFRPFDRTWTAREHAWDLSFSASTDGGTNFSAPLCVLESPSRTDPKMGFWVYGGDYLLSLHRPTERSMRSGSRHTRRKGRDLHRRRSR